MKHKNALAIFVRVLHRPFLASQVFVSMADPFSVDFGQSTEYQF